MTEPNLKYLLDITLMENTLLHGKIDALEAALRLVQWGSCDGCGSGGFCPECDGAEPWGDEYTDGTSERGRGHKPDCPVGLALEAKP